MATPLSKLFKNAVKMHTARDFKAAADLYQKIIRGDPGHIDALYMFGTLKAEQGDLAAAHELLTQAATLAPQSPMIQNNLGNVHLKSERLDEAAICYQRALQYNPNMPETHFNLACISLRQEKLAEAAQGFEMAAFLKPDFFRAHLYLGNLHKTLGDTPMAIRSYRNALELLPSSHEALYGLANALAALQQREEAATCFRRLLELNPGDESAQFALAALRGETPATAPRAHVAGIFNEMAESFDSHLAQLDYRIPEMLRDVMINIAGPDAHFKNCIDLGCGTGISGAAFRPYTDRISGIDVSGKMIAAARNKSIYDALFEDDVVEHLSRNDGLFDLVLATDVFIYVGELRALFAAVKKRTMPGAYFLFSTERCDDADYVLRPSGRYAHSPAYIESLAAEFGFMIVSGNPAKIRMEAGVPLMGDIFALRRNNS